MREELDGARAIDEQVVLAIDDRMVAALPDVPLMAAGRRAMRGVAASYSDRFSTTTWETLATDRPDPTI
jgi:hypothetical protein